MCRYSLELVCDVDSFTLGRLIDDVLLKKMGMNAPEIEAPEDTLFLQDTGLDEVGRCTLNSVDP